MRILLDECVPKQLKDHFPGIEVWTTRAKRWTGIRNGELLNKMKQEGFTVLITVDRNLVKNENVAQSGVAVVLLRAIFNDVEHLGPLTELVRAALPTLQPGQYVEIGTLGEHS